jgi:glyceraldehyde 3-phosphate dehydrogenase
VGRGLLRALWQRGLGAELRLASEINPRGRPPEELAANLAYLLAYDSVYGAFPAEVGVRGQGLLLDGRELPLVLDTPPESAGWRRAGVRILVEATGEAASIAAAAGLAGRAVDKVVITRSAAPAQATLVRGVNLDAYDPARHHAVSCSTCTANAAAPVLWVLDQAFGVERASLTTVHPALSADTLLDSPAPEFAAGRGGLQVRPVASEVAATTAQVLPGLAGRLVSMSLRVPTTIVNAMVADVTLARPPAAAGEAAEVLARAAAGPLAGVLRLEEGLLGRPRPAGDFAADPHSAVVDASWLALSGPLLRLLIWHDNEYAYCQRVADVVEAVAAALD